MIDVLGEVARKQHVVLQCRIDVFSSRMALNCFEGTISAEIITVLTRYRPIVLELI